MNTQELQQSLTKNQSTKNGFAGVFSCDKIPISATTLPFHFVANTDPSTAPGAHWVAFYQDKADVVETFDSYGRLCTTYAGQFDSFLKNKQIVSQSHQLQSSTSHTCGQFCLFFLLRRCSGESYQQILHLFSDNSVHNDIVVTQYCNFYFKINTTMYDPTMLLQAATALRASK